MIVSLSLGPLFTVLTWPRHWDAASFFTRAKSVVVPYFVASVVTSSLFIVPEPGSVCMTLRVSRVQMKRQVDRLDPAFVFLHA